MNAASTDNDAIGSGNGQRDNRNLTDDNSAQKLSASEIEEMKRFYLFLRFPTFWVLHCFNFIFSIPRSGISGKEIVQALVEHSATFQNKTEFSQVWVVDTSISRKIVALSCVSAHALYNRKST